MNIARRFATLALILAASALLAFAPRAFADTPLPLGDALQVPARPRTSAYADNPAPDQYQPSAFLAGKVAVRVVFVESNGRHEPSTRDWVPGQIAAIRDQIGTALDWWAARLPNAHLKFDLTSVVAPSGYEPVLHGLASESQWVGDTLQNLGVTAPNYFDQAYAADEALRRERNADWATNIFVVNSTGTADGRFADGYFAYAYVNGPFMVITSDAGPYGANQIAPVVAHEFGHIFGALDQYAAAGVPCSQKSGYLAVPNSNSQANNCGTKLNSIMLDPLGAYNVHAIDPSALGQLGYRDSDGDRIPDPLDTAPALRLQLNQPAAGTRPAVTGQAIDVAYASPTGDLATINTIARVEYRADGGAWLPLPPADGAYDQVVENLNSVLPLYDGNHAVELRAINRVGASSPIARYTLAVSGVGAAPAYQISAPKVGNSQHIVVATTAPAGSMVQASENPFFYGASWAPAGASVGLVLGANEGPRPIYVRFRDAAGLESPALSAVTTLDRTPPAGRAMLVHRSDGVWLEIQAQDGATRIDAMQLTMSQDASAAWQPFQPSLPMTLQAASVFVRLRDAAGNVSQPLEAVPMTQVWVPVAAR